MQIRVLRLLRWFLTAVFALLAACFIGLSIYAVIQFGLWWPRWFGAGPAVRLLLAIITMLPFLLLFTRLNWSRPSCSISGDVRPAPDISSSTP